MTSFILWKYICSFYDILKLVKPRYGNNLIPFEIRSILAEWLEDRLLYGDNEQYSEEHQDYHTHAQMFYAEFVQVLSQKIADLQENNLSLRFILVDTLHTIKSKYHQNPGPFYTNLLTSLQYEHYLYERHIAGDSLLSADLNVIQNELNLIKIGVQEIEQCINQFNYIQGNMSTVQDQIIVSIDNFSQCNTNQCLSEKFIKIINNVEVIQKTILKEHLPRWTEEQEKLRGKDPTTYTILPKKLETIQVLCEQLIWVECTLLNQIQKFKGAQLKVEEQNGLVGLCNRVQALLDNMIISAIVIDTQPPELVKTGTNFKASIRFLTRSALNFNPDKITVRASVESEEQVAHILSNNEKSIKIPAVEKLSNNKVDCDYDNITKICRASFTKLNISKRPEKITDKKLVESVLDKKHYLYFESKFTVNGVEYKIWTLSQPFVVIVHASQEPKAMATLLWDLNFIRTDQRYINTPHVVAWDNLAKTLSDKFKSECGRGLNADHLEFLKEKILNGSNEPNPMVTYSQFCKENLPGRKHTFWDWFYATMKFCKKNIKAMWSKGDLIIGFISKSKAEEILLERGCPGMFLLRFSEGEPGSVKIAYVEENMESKEIIHIAPFNERSLAARCLSNCIKDLPVLSTLYPNTPKSNFEEFVTKDGRPNKSGYVKPTMSIVIPKTSSQSTASSPAFSYESSNSYCSDTSNYMEEDLYLKPSQCHIELMN